MIKFTPLTVMRGFTLTVTSSYQYKSSKKRASNTLKQFAVSGDFRKVKLIKLKATYQNLIARFLFSF